MIVLTCTLQCDKWASESAQQGLTKAWIDISKEREQITLELLLALVVTDSKDWAKRAECGEHP